MASSEHQYNSEFKATVALEALARSKRDLDQLSEKYEVPVSLILTWTAQLERNAAHIYATTEPPEDILAQTAEHQPTVDVGITDSDIKESFLHGVMHDDLNYKKLFFWAVIGVIIFLIFVQSVVEMYQSSVKVAQEQSATQNEHYQSNIQKKAALERLSSFGVVKLDSSRNVYHMPIDTAIDEMAAHAANKSKNDTTQMNIAKKDSVL